MQNILNKYKPEAVYLQHGRTSCHLEVKGKKYALDLKSEDNVRKFIILVERLPQYVRTEKSDNVSIFRFNWSAQTSLTEQSRTLNKDEEPNQKVQQTQQTDSQQQVTTQQQTDENLKNKTEKQGIDFTDIKTKEELFNVIDKTIQGEELLSVVVTSTGNLLKDGNLQSSLIDGTSVKKVYDEYSQQESNAVGSIKKEININGNPYLILMWKVGDEVTVQITRDVEDVSDLQLSVSSDMRVRYEKLNDGLIVTSLHPLIKMEHIIPMMEMIDPHFKRTACSVGDNLLVTKLPSQPTDKYIKNLKNTHYKYILISSDEDSNLNIDEILDLMYSGKTIIIGFRNDSTYANLISLMSLCKGDSFKVTKVLMSTVGIVHPILTIKDNKFTLEETETVTLTSRRAQSIINGDLSKEKFNLYVEKPSKVYRLGSSDGNSLTQEEEFHSILRKAVELKASDIHLAVGKSPMLRIHGRLKPIDENIKLKPEVIENIAQIIARTEQQRTTLETENEISLPYSVYGLGRFRVQISTQRGTKYIVLRRTESEIPSVEQLRIPKQVVNAILNNPKGLVLVTGPTGSGKSTTSASLIDALKRDKPYVITSVSDPIEFLHSHGDGIVTQREIPSDVETFEKGLLSAFRSDPDIIEVAEMRTPESVHACMRFANSGHLVITTYHTHSVKATIDALLNRVEPERQNELLSTLSQTVIAIVNQTLVEGKNGKRIPIFEYLLPDREIRHYIAANKITSIESKMKSSALTNKKIGTWADYELIEAYDRGEITQEVMYKYLNNKTSIEEMKNNKEAWSIND